MNWSLRKSLMIIGVSVLTTSLLTLSSYSVYSHWRNKRLTSDKYKVTAIVQTGPEKEVLRTAYLAELLGLSVDAPKILYAIDVRKAELALLSSPLISKAKVKRMPPNTLYVDYEVRKPIAWLSDYRNTAIDAEGYLFPVAPFLTPKEMPEIYLGLPAFGKEGGGTFREPLQTRTLTLAFEILHTFEESPWKEGLRIKRLDVSNAFAPTLGRREIVLFTEEQVLLADHTFTFPKILRLAPKDYAQQLLNFFSLRRSMLEDYKRQLASLHEDTRFAPRIVDLRINQLAFVEN